MLLSARGGLIERTDVAASIVAALERGSLQVIAGAGYGKTTALRQALDPGPRSAWVRCGDAGQDAGRLLALILAAVSRALPGAADALAEQLASSRTPIDPPRAAAALEGELASVLIEPLVIVFDDAESLSDSPVAVEVIERLLLSESPQLRVAVATRWRLNVRAARGRAMGRISELGPSDLVFSAADCATYLHQARGVDPEPSEVEALLAATAGWPLGIALAGSGDDLVTPGPSPGVVHDYFEEEITGRLDPELQHALLQASMAPDLVVAERAGLGPQEGFASAVDRHGLFVRGDGTTSGRELHPLFRDFLRARFLNQAPLEEQRSVNCAIAAALESSGREVEAVDYRLAGEDWAAAAQGVARQGAELVRSAPDTVAAWIGALPDEYASRPDVELLAGELAHGQGRFGEAVALCRSAADALDAAEAPADQRFAARFALADVLMALADLPAAAALSAVLDEPDATGNLAARAVAVVAAAALARQGRFEEARSVCERALDDPSARMLQGIAPTFASYYLELPAGQLDDALTHAREAVRSLEVTDPTGRLAYALAFLMSILEERGEDEEALAVAERTREWSQRVGLGGWVGVVLAIRSASVRTRRGDLAGAEADLAEVPPDWRVWGAWELHANRAAILSLRGDGERALVAAEQSIRESEGRWPYFDRARCAALLAPTLSAAGHPQRARELVQQTIAVRIPGFSTARLHAVLAWLLHDDGDEEKSIAALQTAWREAGDQMRHIVRREWPRIERPLWAALERGEIEVGPAVEALSAAQPGGGALANFTHHPVASVRRAALLSAVAAGHPDGIGRVPELRRDADPSVRAAAQTAGELLLRNPPPLSFRLLGRFELRRGTWLVEDAAWGRRVAQRLVRFLLCRGGGPVPEDELIESFWPDSPPESARRSAQVAVSAARAILDPPGAQRSRLTCSERTYRLELREEDTVDSREFERAAAAALDAHTPSRRAALSTAAALWGGEPLPEERYAEWATPWRERLIDRYIQILTALSEAHEQAGDANQALEVARRLVELDRLNEAAHRRLMVAAARAGRRGQALRQFLACRHALVTELGVEPGEETRALHRRVLAGEPV